MPYPPLSRVLRSGELLSMLVGLGTLIACGSSDSGRETSGTGAGGAQTADGVGGNALATGGIGGGGSLPTGGTQATGGVGPTGGTTLGSGGAPTTGGTTASGGTTTASGGTPATGGTTATGGASEGGTVATGGSSEGGTVATGGASEGGTVATGGLSEGGTVATGGSSEGGTVATGGSSEGGTAATGGSAGSSSTGDVTPSSGCGVTPTLQNSPQGASFSVNTLSVDGTNREFVIRWPTDYDNTHPHRLHLTLHGYGGTYAETAGDYFGLWSLSNNTTVFIALSAIQVDWRTGDNLAYVDAVLEAVEANLCIDTSRVTLEGFSQGAAMSWTLACSRPGVFRAVVGHSGGGVTNPTECEPIPYFGSGGLQESVTQTTQSDQFAEWNGCTVTSLPTAPSGGHVCSDYTGCPEAAPVRWCNFDGPHTPSPSDSGQGTSWMPSEVWPFLTQF